MLSDQIKIRDRESVAIKSNYVGLFFSDRIWQAKYTLKAKEIKSEREKNCPKNCSFSPGKFLSRHVISEHFACKTSEMQFSLHSGLVKLTCVTEPTKTISDFFAPKAEFREFSLQ